MNLARESPNDTAYQAPPWRGEMGNRFASGPALDTHDHAELRALLGDAIGLFTRDAPVLSP